MRREVPQAKVKAGVSITDLLVRTGLASSKTEARRLLEGNAVSINNLKISKDKLEKTDFQEGRLLLRKGKAFKDSALIELA
jgi:tyrosyl-tRNA synthetase